MAEGDAMHWLYYTSRVDIPCSNRHRSSRDTCHLTLPVDPGYEDLAPRLPPFRAFHVSAQDLSYYEATTK